VDATTNITLQTKDDVVTVTDEVILPMPVPTKSHSI
jgi:hypothetical protein